MSLPKSKIYVLKPFRASSQIPTLKEFLDVPAPEVVFGGRHFCFTGSFIFGDDDREQCKAAVQARGGHWHNRPYRKLDYLVIGGFVKANWVYETHGRKIESAIALKNSGAHCKIISEEHWVKFVKNIPEQTQKAALSSFIIHHSAFCIRSEAAGWLSNCLRMAATISGREAGLHK